MQLLNYMSFVLKMRPLMLSLLIDNPNKLKLSHDLYTWPHRIWSLIRTLNDVTEFHFNQNNLLERVTYFNINETKNS